jgi:DNA-binding NtrC family response regulator
MKRVLVVDDDEALRESLSMALTDEFEVSTAASAEEALAILEHGGAQAMVLDEEMPGLSGLGLLERLCGRNLPGTIMLSGRASVELARQAMRLGASDLLAKPCNVNQLKEMLHRAAERVPRSGDEVQPLALFGARALKEAWAQEGSPLPERSRRLSRVVAVEAIRVCKGDRLLAAERLDISPAELDWLASEEP